MNEPMTRRTMMTYALAGTVVGGSALMMLFWRNTDLKLDDPSWLLAGFDTAAQIAIGRQYLADHPKERDLATLTAEVGRAKSGPWSWSPVLPSIDVVAAEFALDETVIVDGWLLSRTEARLCAGLALTSGQAPT
ncbi:MAG: hypothetical protein IBJ03_15840 [Gemmatimonadaceae bacterium]|nr:hypothetical protein [Gemmatimonadaceae bacterium]